MDVAMLRSGCGRRSIMSESREALDNNTVNWLDKPFAFRELALSTGSLLMGAAYDGELRRLHRSERQGFMHRALSSYPRLLLRLTVVDLALLAYERRQRSRWIRKSRRLNTRHGYAVAAPPNGVQQSRLHVTKASKVEALRSTLAKRCRAAEAMFSRVNEKGSDEEVPGRSPCHALKTAARRPLVVRTSARCPELSCAESVELRGVKRAD